MGRVNTVRKEITKEVVRTIQIEYEFTNDGIICKDILSAQYIWGSSISGYDLKRHLQEKENGTYLLPMLVLVKRKIILADRVKRSQNALDTISQILKERDDRGDKNASKKSKKGRKKEGEKDKVS